MTFQGPIGFVGELMTVKGTSGIYNNDLAIVGEGGVGSIVAGGDYYQRDFM
jgi:hypothetical protein